MKRVKNLTLFNPQLGCDRDDVEAQNDAGRHQLGWRPGCVRCGFSERISGRSSFNSGKGLHSARRRIPDNEQSLPYLEIGAAALV